MCVNLSFDVMMCHADFCSHNIVVERISGHLHSVCIYCALFNSVLLFHYRHAVVLTFAIFDIFSLFDCLLLGVYC